MKIDVQFSPGRNDWPALRDAVVRAEQDGYDSTWVFDHFDSWMLDGDRPMLECCTLLGALAATTSTIGLGTLVANVANRHPAVLAAAASSVQRISNGRFTLGLGAGTSPVSRWSREHHARGIELRADINERHDAVARQIAAVRALPERIPVIVGVNSVSLARRAAELADGINVRLAHDRAAEFIAAAREIAGDRPFEISGWTFDEPDVARDRYASLQLDRLIITRLGSVA